MVVFPGAGPHHVVVVGINNDTPDGIGTVPVEYRAPGSSVVGAFPYVARSNGSIYLGIRITSYNVCYTKLLRTLIFAIAFMLIRLLK